MQAPTHRIRTVLVVALVALSVVAVAPSASAVSPQGYAQQGTGNGTATNGTDANGTATNGTATNETATNGGDTHGTDANDTAANGTATNGTTINGTSDAGGTDLRYENATVVDSLDDIEYTAIGNDGEADVYAVRLEKGSQVEVIQGSGGGAYPVTFLDRDGTVLDRIPDQRVYTGDESTIVADANYTGYYYLKIDGEPGETYSILSSVVEPDGNEPDDSPDEATAIEVGETASGTVIRNDPDYYAIDLSAGDEVAVEANGSASAEVALRAENGNTVGSGRLLSPGGYEEGELGQSAAFNATIERDGTYFVDVSIPENDTGNVNGDYNLTIVEANSASSGNETDSGSTDATRTDDTTNTASQTTPTNATATTGRPTTTHTATTSPDEATTTEDGSGNATTSDDATADGTTRDGSTGSSATTGTTADATATTMTTMTTTGTDAASTAGDAPTSGNGGADGASETAVNGPGFGVLTALLALLGAALLTARRR